MSGNTHISALPREVREAWARALKSGNFQKCIGVLCDSKNRLCALGVYHHTVEGVPLEILKDRMVFNDFDPWVTPTKRMSSYNDHGATFEQIAEKLLKW